VGRGVPEVVRTGVGITPESESKRKWGVYRLCRSVPEVDRMLILRSAFERVSCRKGVANGTVERVTKSRDVIRRLHKLDILQKWDD
jgi:hypothetical protein